MPSATAFLPSNISVFVNFETSLSLYFGSGMMRRFGTSLRRGIASGSFSEKLEVGDFRRYLVSGLASGLGPLDAVLGALAVTVCFVRGRRTDGARRVEGSADDVVTHTREILHTAATNEDDRVLLQVVTLAGDVRGD